MTTENGLLHPHRMGANIDRLRRRADFLRARIAERGDPQGNGFDAAELAALEWALPVLEDERIRAIRLCRHILAMAGVPTERRDAMIHAGHPR